MPHKDEALDKLHFHNDFSIQTVKTKQEKTMNREQAINQAKTRNAAETGNFVHVAEYLSKYQGWIVKRYPRTERKKIYME